MPSSGDSPSPPPPSDGREFFRPGSGDIREQLQHLNVRQKDFEKYLARQLDVDELGLETMYHLISQRTATPTALAHSADISTAAMTLVLNRLETAGHISRAPHPSDRRKVVITAAPASEDLAYQLVAPVINGLEEIVQALDDRERSVIERFLTRVLGLYQTVTPTG